MARYSHAPSCPGGNQIGTAGTVDWKSLTEAITLALGQRSRHGAITAFWRASIGLWSYSRSPCAVSMRNDGVTSDLRPASPGPAEAFCRARLDRNVDHFVSAGIMTESYRGSPEGSRKFLQKRSPSRRGDRVSALPVGPACGTASRARHFHGAVRGRHSHAAPAPLTGGSRVPIVFLARAASTNFHW